VIVHLIVSKFVLLCALAAATWIRPLTARTRHAILLAGMTALVVPPALFARLVERSAPVRKLAGAMPRFNAVLNVAPQTTRAISWIQVATIVWCAVAIVVLLRWLIVTQRVATSALRIATPPPQSAVAALDAARRRLSLRRSVDLIMSSLCEAPAVIRVVRPLIVLPTHGVDALDDEELQSLLCHECAHVARHDNLLGVFEAIVFAVFWFNPVVWLARRQLAITREAACDELVADTASRAETYVGALAKFCESLVAPRVPAVSCMASAHLKERIQHVMRYDSLKTGALSHRAIAATASIVVALFVAGAGIATATPENATASRYLLNYSAAKSDDGTLTIRTKIVDGRSNETIGEPTIVTKNGAPATADLTRDDLRFHLVFDHDALSLDVYERDAVTQHVSINIDSNKIEHASTYTGDKISLNLKDADLKDVLGTFAKLTGLQMKVDPDVHGKVTMNFTQTPWDEALDRIIRENGLAYTLDGKNMHVFVKR